MKFHRVVKGLMVMAAMVITVVVLSGCGKQKQAMTTIKVGIIDSQDNQVWNPIKKKLAKQGVNVKTVLFTDLGQPNPDLKDNQIQMNEFQTLQFLQTWNKANHGGIVAAGKSIISPYSIYSNKIKHISQLKAGDTVAFANSPTDEGRALHTLEVLGLIKYKHVALPTTKDITENKKHLKFETLDAAQVPRSLQDVDAAFINGAFALNSKISPKKRIYEEKLTKFDRKYVNYLATNKKYQHSAAIKKIVAAYQSEANKRNIRKAFKGFTLPAWDLELK